MIIVCMRIITSYADPTVALNSSLNLGKLFYKSRYYIVPTFHRYEDQRIPQRKVFLKILKNYPLSIITEAPWPNGKAPLSGGGDLRGTSS